LRVCGPGQLPEGVWRENIVVRGDMVARRELGGPGGGRRARVRWVGKTGRGYMYG